jgi:two-component system chemotaxis response regulator CheY
MALSVLIVDDSEPVVMVLTHIINASGFNVIGNAKTAEEALTKAKELKPDVITLDTILPDELGVDLIKRFNDEGVKSKVIFISGTGSDDIIKKAMDNGAVDYILKPFQTEVLVSALNKLA